MCINMLCFMLPLWIYVPHYVCSIIKVMLRLLTLKLCGCFGIRKQKRKPGSSMKVVSGSLLAFKRKKFVRFEQNGDTLVKNASWWNRSASEGDVEQDPSSAPCREPRSVWEVEAYVVLVVGLKCRSGLRGDAGPGVYASPGCTVAVGPCERRK